MTQQRGALSLPLYQVDAFASRPFRGNSAAVILLPERDGPDDETLQDIAMENNLSETSFLEPIPAGEDAAAATNFHLRWFTPTREVKLCGHATLAASAAIWDCLGNGAERLRFQTLSGELTVTRGGDGRLAMDFPLNRAEASDKGYTAADGALVRALTGEAGVAEVLLNENLQMLLVVLRGGREELLALKPNPAELLAAQGSDLVGTIVTCKGDGEDDFFYRFFAPWAGIDEDPVTGSAATVVGPYWATQLGKAQLRAKQLSKRVGELWVEVREGDQRVVVSGHAVPVIEGKFLLPRKA